MMDGCGGEVQSTWASEERFSGVETHEVLKISGCGGEVDWENRDGVWVMG